MTNLATLKPDSPSIEAINHHVRTYRSALKSSREVTISGLTGSFLKMQPILHQYGYDQTHIDVDALCYALFRLPTCIDTTQVVVLGQTPEVFAQSGYPNVEKWGEVDSVSRRRRMRYSVKKHILAGFINSVSDIDDIVNILISLQLEWNKLHELLKIHSLEDILTADQIASFTKSLGKDYAKRLKAIQSHPLNLKVQLLAGSWIDYAKAIQKWWKNIAKTTSDKFHISHQNLYFVSSNSHSLVNLFTSHPLKNKSLIIDYLQKNKPELFDLWQKVSKGEHNLKPEDFLYFCSRFIRDPSYLKSLDKKVTSLDILRIPNESYLDSNIQIFPVKSLASPSLDPYLKVTKPKKLSQSKNYILNIDYPLGFAAYHILTEILENAQSVKGVYVMGKAAVLNSEIGDIEVPRVVYDEHTQNSYLFHNCFNHNLPFTNVAGSILTNQKAVSVLGTYLQNQALIQDYAENNFTIIEMESGSYLSAIAEATYDQRLPVNTIIDLNNAPFDIGIINYTSDTPYGKTTNLGARTLDVAGVEPTYLAARAILDRIITLEEQS